MPRGTDECATFIYKLPIIALEMQPQIRLCASGAAMFVSSVGFAVGFVWRNSYFMFEAKAS